jgi:hypothetical protein
MAAIGRPRRNGMDLALDDPIARRIQDAFTSAQVDPLFRRRLRSDVVNRYVAIREGHLAVRAVGRPLAHGGVMGRLGRACLYASVALVGSAAGVLAASQTALPGDALYDVKLRIDALRLEAAPPDLRAAVAEYIVGERLDELTVLAADGEWARATEAAEAAGAQAESLAALLTADPAAEARIERHLEVLASLLTSAPPAARDALEHAMAVSDSAIGPPPADALHANRGGNANEAANGNGAATGNSNAEGAADGTAGTGSGGTGSSGSTGANASGSGSDSGNGADDAPAATPPSPVPSAAVDDAATNEEAQGGSGNDAADSHPAAPEPPSPTPRASIPPQANQGSD